METEGNHDPARILIIDDEEANVILLRRVLARAGYDDVRGITDPRSVATLVAEFEPNLLLLDLAMPHLDGFAVMELLRGSIPEHAQPSILVLTADVTPETKRRALSTGAKDFITKPFDVEEVVLRIGNVLETWRLRRELELHRKALLRAGVSIS